MSTNITDVSVLSPSIEVEGNLPVVQCLDCHQSLKEAAGQTKTLLDLMKEVKKLRAIVIRSESIPASMSNRVPRSERQGTNSAEARPNISRQKKLKVGMSPQSKLAKLNRLRQTAASGNRAKRSLPETSPSNGNDQQQDATASTSNDNDQQLDATTSTSNDNDQQPDATASTSNDNEHEPSSSASTSNDNEHEPSSPASASNHNGQEQEPSASSSASSTAPAGTSSQGVE